MHFDIGGVQLALKINILLSVSHKLVECMHGRDVLIIAGYRCNKGK